MPVEDASGTRSVIETGTNPYTQPGIDGFYTWGTSPVANTIIDNTRSTYSSNNFISGRSTYSSTLSNSAVLAAGSSFARYNIDGNWPTVAYAGPQILTPMEITVIERPESNLFEYIFKMTYDNYSYERKFVITKELALNKTATAEWFRSAIEATESGFWKVYYGKLDEVTSTEEEAAARPSIIGRFFDPEQYSIEEQE